MSKTLYMTKGLPGCGKSTWALAKVREDGTNVTKRVNKDDLRAMIDGGKYSKGNEKFILDMRDELVINALMLGKNVIVDDTNLEPKHESVLREIAKYNNATFKVVDFTDVPVALCMERDSRRAKSIGKEAILRLYNKYLGSGEDLHPHNHYRDYDIDKIDAVIIDVDGTIAQRDGRTPYEYDKVGTDKPIDAIINFIDRLRMGPEQVKFFVVSGRDDSCREATYNWLVKYNVPFDTLLMRKAGDQRKDSIIKRELYEQHIEHSYNVVAVFDDRDQVVEMWRKELKLPTFQVWWGAF